MHATRALTIAALALGCLTVACGGDDEESTPATGTGGGGGQAGGGGTGPQAGAELPCEPGELLLGDGSCLAPGVPADGCGTGFSLNSNAACDPILPSTACVPSQLALLGETTCRAVGPCGSGPWGDIPTDNTTQHVDASYSGGNNDGSSTRPFTGVQQAIDAAADGAIVAIANGTYNSSLSIVKPVRVWGRCAEGVTLSGSGQAVSVSGSAAIGAELRGVSVTGPAFGVRVSGAVDVLLERVRIHDTGNVGLDAEDTGTPGSVTLRNSLIESTTEAGVRAFNADIAIEDSIIRAVDPKSDGTLGMGIDARGWGATPDMSVTVQRSVIEDVHTSGLYATGPITVLLEDSYVVGTQAEVATSTGGDGVFSYWQSAFSDGARPTTTIRRSVLERNTRIGVLINGVDFVMEHSVVRDTQPEAGPLGVGIGVTLYAVELTPGGVRPTGTFTQSVIENSLVNGVELNGVDARLESCIIRDVEPRPDGTNGVSLTAFPSSENGDPTDVTLMGGRFERTKQGNIAISGSNAIIDSIAVLDTNPRELDGGLGVALAIMINPDNLARSTATIERTVVDGAFAAGIVVSGSDATMNDVIVRNILPQQNLDDFGDGIAVSAKFPLLQELHPTSATLTRVTVDGAPRAGVSVFGADATLSDSLLTCDAIDIAAEIYNEQAFSLDDAGGNVCGCDAEVWDCRVLTSNLQPPLGI
jgi:hypothetical protein